MLSLAVAVDSLRATVPCSLLSVAQVPFAAAALGVGAVSWTVPRKVFQRMDNALYRAYMRLCLFVFENVSGVEINLYGDIVEMRARKESALVIANHQSNVDWAAILMLAARQGEDGHEAAFRVMVKQAIHYVPLFGWYIFQHGYIYVRRFGAFVSQPVRRQLEWLDGLGEEGFWLLVFPEGTRYSATKRKLIAASQHFCEQKGVAPLQHVLAPRAGGVQLAVDNLKNLDAVYDVTVAYGQTQLPGRAGIAPNMFEFVCGPRVGRSIHLHVKRIPIGEVPKDPSELRSWLLGRFTEKDRLLSAFHSGSPLPDLVEADVPALPLRRTLPATAAFVAAIVAPWFVPEVKRVYLFTVASFPLLIVWLQARKCV